MRVGVWRCCFFCCFATAHTLSPQPVLIHMPPSPRCDTRYVHPATHTHRHPATDISPRYLLSLLFLLILIAPSAAAPRPRSRVACSGKSAPLRSRPTPVEIGKSRGVDVWELEFGVVYILCVVEMWSGGQCS